MKVGFIGAGKVGCSLYDYFVHNNIPVTGCYTRTQAKVSETEKQTQKIFTTSIVSKGTDGFNAIPALHPSSLILLIVTKASPSMQSVWGVI